MRSNDAATAMPDGSCVAFGELTPVNADIGSPAWLGGTQSLWPTPTGPFVMRNVGIRSRGMPGT